MQLPRGASTRFTYLVWMWWAPAREADDGRLVPVRWRAFEHPGPTGLEEVQLYDGIKCVGECIEPPFFAAVPYASPGRKLHREYQATMGRETKRLTTPQTRPKTHGRQLLCGFRRRPQ